MTAENLQNIINQQRLLTENETKLAESEHKLGTFINAQLIDEFRHYIRLYDALMEYFGPLLPPLESQPREAIRGQTGGVWEQFFQQCERLVQCRDENFQVAFGFYLHAMHYNFEREVPPHTLQIPEARLWLAIQQAFAGLGVNQNYISDALTSYEDMRKRRQHSWSPLLALRRLLKR